jgi:hypothetical protein
VIGFSDVGENTLVRFRTPAEIISKELGQTFRVDAAVFGKLLGLMGTLVQ